MRDRIKKVYLTLGRILNDPAGYGLGPQTPKMLADTLGQAQQKLMEELREERPESDFLSAELSQDADRDADPHVTATAVPLRKTG
jgi:hypothetical protein